MFSSHRFSWDTTPNRLSTALEAKRREGADVIDLTNSNPTHCGLSYPLREITDSFQSEGLLRYDPDPRGMLRARESVATYYSDSGIAVTPDDMHLTSSTSEAYSLLLKLLTDPGDEILVPKPGYPLMEYLAALEQVRPAPYLLAEDSKRGWRLDEISLEAMVSDRTRAIVVVHPNNPTGSYFTTEEMEYIHRFGRARGIALIADEVFFDYHLRDTQRHASFLSLPTDGLLFVLNGFSKILGLPQMKLGWITTRGEQRWVERAGKKLDLLCDTFLSVGTPVQEAAGALLSLRPDLQKQIRDRCHRNLRILHDTVDEKGGLAVPGIEGGWNALIRLPLEIDEEDFALTLLREKDVFVHPGYFYDFPKGAFLVVSLLPGVEDFAEGCRRLLAHVMARRARAMDGTPE